MNRTHDIGHHSPTHYSASYTIPMNFSFLYSKTKSNAEVIYPSFAHRLANRDVATHGKKFGLTFFNSLA